MGPVQGEGTILFLVLFRLPTQSDEVGAGTKLGQKLGWGQGVAVNISLSSMRSILQDTELPTWPT